MLRLLAVTLLAAPCAALAVVCPGGMGAVRTRPSLRIRCAADDGSSSAGKGFGAPKRAAPPAAAPPREPVSRSGATADAAGADDGAAMEARGRLALEAMRREAGQQPVKPRRGPALTPEELEPVDPSAGVMPEVVSNRMLGRVIPFAGVPIALAFVVFVGFYYANTQLDLDLPPSVVAFSTQVLLALSFAGITWGVMSTSWDESEEGSFLGTEQVGKNFQLMRGTYQEGRADAAAEAADEDAAEAGVIMSRQAKRKLDRKKKK